MYARRVGFLAALGMMVGILGAATAHGARFDDPYDVDVTPDGGTLTDREAGAGRFTVVFTVTNSGTEAAAFDISCGGTLVTCTGTNRSAVQLDAGGSARITATFQLGEAAGLGGARLTAAGTGDAAGVLDQGSVHLTITEKSSGR